ncbi:MAG: nucleotidyl transferase AbiEii/AbiGii toxin family protein [bacterium]
MEIQPDFRDLLKLFNDHEVEFLVVGGYALAFHGAPRFTGDLDLFIRPSPSNARRVLDALNDFGFSFPNITLDDFQIPDNVVQLGVPPIRIDLMTSISGVSWAEAESHKVPGMYGDIPVVYLGRAEFVQNKHATGRKKDLADLEALGEA